MKERFGQPGLTRRGVMAHGLAAAAAGLAAPSILRAQSAAVKIGYVGSLSGIRGIFGETEQWTLAQIQTRLAEGLMVGDRRIPIELVIRDNQSSGARSASVAQDLVFRERCNLILAQDGEAAFAVGELADSRGVPTLSSMMPWQAWMFPRGGNPVDGFPYTFHFFGGSDGALSNFVQMMDMVPSNAKVGTLYVDNPPGQGLMNPETGLPAFLRQGGYDEIAAGPFQVTTNDFSSFVSRFAAEQPDILSGFMYPDHFIPFWNQLRQAGVAPKAVMMSAAFLFPGAVAAMGDSADGVATEVFWSPAFPTASSLTGQSAAELAAQWETETGAQWTQPLGYGHAMWEVGLAAIAAADDPRDPDSLRDAIAGLDLNTVAGRVNFATSPVRNVAIMPLVGGQWRRLGGQHPYALKIVNNASAPEIPVEAEMIVMSPS
ncbi:ABC transporter substrate-binding protein [Pararhodobacter zhoushanensis]|uniref:ABC transporter substrate-binding protein n=1 Tax=Pararhodobacter zhoushanensis TaxID=2479545 RepID=A0ABT3H5A7_9RHOB|nr:ABC transporter substrate-binding protein [Pararhodobacter zhoushanensis]MCW1934903.1 ABC transporter substrate-binding protein [Pararhodobacter zhoushanensis]